MSTDSGSSSPKKLFENSIFTFALGIAVAAVGGFLAFQSWLNTQIDQRMQNSDKLQSIIADAVESNPALKGSDGKDGVDGNDGSDAELPTGIVAAFDTPGQCPDGWSPFAEGQSRFIVGASFGLDDGLNADPELTQRKYREHRGGAERVQLSNPELPAHSHEIPQHRHDFEEQALRSSSSGWQFGGNQWFDTLPRGGTTKWSERSNTLETGEAVSHNNMPPFIALYFCKKD